MNVMNGNLVPYSKVATLSPQEQRLYTEIGIELSPEQLRKRKIGRNDACPCRSGKKFKKCCLGKIPEDET